MEFYYVTNKKKVVKKLKSNIIRKEDSTYMRQNFNEIGIIGFGYGGGASWKNGPQNVDMLTYAVDTLNSDLIWRKGYGQPMSISKEDLDKWND